LVERAGRTDKGSITGFYSVLVEGDDINDPVGDAVRGVLDGHVWLSRRLASQSHYPAISVTESISRIMVDVVDEAHLRAARAVRQVLATWNEIEDLVSIGAYAPGTNPQFDTVIQTRPAVLALLQQAIAEHVTMAQAREQLLAVGHLIEQTQQRLSSHASRSAAPPPPKAGKG
jgi:flagellum-specific ATP synthase